MEWIESDIVERLEIAIQDLIVHHPVEDYENQIIKLEEILNGFLALSSMNIEFQGVGKTLDLGIRKLKLAVFLEDVKNSELKRAIVGIVDLLAKQGLGEMDVTDLWNMLQPKIITEGRKL